MFDKDKIESIEESLIIDYGKKRKKKDNKDDLIVTSVKLTKTPIALKDLDEYTEVNIAQNNGSKLGKIPLSELKKKIGLR